MIRAWLVPKAGEGGDTMMIMMMRLQQSMCTSPPHSTIACGCLTYIIFNLHKLCGRDTYFHVAL